MFTLKYCGDDFVTQKAGEIFEALSLTASVEKYTEQKAFQNALIETTKDKYLLTFVSRG